MRSLKRVVQTPLILVAWDNSGSMVATGDSLEIANGMKQLKDKLSDELGDDHSLINYTFGQETVSSGELGFSEKKSDYSHLFTTLANNHFNENIGALILAGDGIYNQGRNPVNMMENSTFPVFTIGYGDTTRVSDARIQTVRVNRTAFSGNRFPVEIDTHFSLLRGRPLRLTIHSDETEVGQTVISPPNDDYFHIHEFILEAGRPGLKHFTATIEAAENERNTKNNIAHFVVNVLENKQKILILSEGPHPDIGAIKHTLEQQKSYEVSVYTEEPYPSSFNEFNLVILNQLPSPGRSMARIMDERSGRQVPLLFLVGPKTFLPQFNALVSGAEIQPLAGTNEEVQAVVNPGFGTFTLSEGFRDIVQRFPPLLTPFANFRLDPAITPLLYQRVKNIETGKPLLATGIINGRKTGFLFGEGIWRWRLNNYLQNQTHEQFSELISQLVQYLALRQNEDNFMIDYEPVYAEIDNVVLHAEVYNDAFERITDNEVTILIENEQGNQFEFTFDIQGESYVLNAGNLPVGNYSFTSEVNIGNQTYYETGNFAVMAVNLENIVTRANHHMLYQLASLSNGGFYLPEEADEMISRLKDSNKLKSTYYFQEMINELLNLKWMFFVMLLLLSMEWFLRKYWGIY